MRLIYFFSLLLISAAGFSQSKIKVDSTFGVDGFSTGEPGSAYFTGKKMAVQPDGKILVAEDISLPPDFVSAILVMRLNKDGGRDASFGTDGYVHIRIGDKNSAFVYDLHRQKDGKIVLAGTTENGSEGIYFTVRLLDDGSRDPSFGTDGLVTTRYGLKKDAGASGVISLAGGKLLASGDVNDTVFKFSLVRYLEDGALDLTFAKDGWLVYKIGDYESSISHGMMIDEDSLVYVYGNAARGGVADNAIVRYDLDGNVDHSFGNHGEIIFKVDPYVKSRLVSVTKTKDHKILAAGYTFDNNQSRLFVVKYENNGLPDSGFDKNKELYAVNIQGKNTVLSGVVELPDGRLAVSGYTNYKQSDPSRYNMFVLIADAAGNIDKSIGENGFWVLEKERGLVTFASALQDDDHLLVAGNNNLDSQIVTTRLLFDLNVGTIDFITGTTYMIYPNPLSDRVNLSYSLEKHEKITIMLTDMSGRTIQRWLSDDDQAAGRHNLNLGFSPGLLPGNYLITISNGKNIVSVKVAKQ